jgi:peptidyl-prolyl cis-trans isomerase SurA
MGARSHAPSRALLALALLAAAPLTLAGLPVARVNGVAIDRAQLDRAFADHAARKGRNVAAIQSPNAFRQLMREALDLLVDEELLAQEAVRRGHHPSAEEVARAVAEARARLTGPAQFEIMLERDGLTEATFADRLAREVAVDRLVTREIAPGLEVADAEVHAWYVANRASVGQPEEAAREVIRQRLLAGKTRAAVRARVEALRRAATIEILVPLEPTP